MGGDDISFHRRLFELDQITPASVAALVWQLRAGQTEGATRRVLARTRAMFGIARYSADTARRGRVAARLAVQLSCPLGTVQALPAIIEHWDGSGQPGERGGEQIPIIARVVAVAQAAVIWGETGTPGEAVARVEREAGRRFDPAVARALRRVLGQGLPPGPGTWVACLTAELDALGEPPLLPQPLQVTTVAEVFAEIIDAKSPFTASHSRRVAALAGAMATLRPDPAVPSDEVILAGLLHDLGKLAIPNAILDKPGSLDDEEWAVLRQHPADSARIVAMVPGWRSLATWVGAHHERPDGRGYHQGLSGVGIAPVARLLAVADAFDAMTADRPYRAGLPVEEALRRLAAGRGAQFDPEAVDLLAAVVTDTRPDARLSA